MGNFLDRLMLPIDRQHPGQDLASGVTIAGGIGLVAAVTFGWPLAVGYAAGFVPAFILGAVVHLSRA